MKSMPAAVFNSSAERFWLKPTLMVPTLSLPGFSLAYFTMSATDL